MVLLSFTLISVAFITAVFLTWYFIHKSNQEERKLYIEKGVEPSELPKQAEYNFRFPWLKIGCVVTAASAGLLIGVILSAQFRILSPGTEFITLFIGGGIGMILANYLNNPNDKS